MFIMLINLCNRVPSLKYIYRDIWFQYLLVRFWVLVLLCAMVLMGIGENCLGEASIVLSGDDLKWGCIFFKTLMTIGGFRRRNIFYEIDILFCTESVTFGKVECQMCGHGMLPVGLWGRTTLNNMQLSNTMKIYHLNDITFNESNYLLNWCPI